VKINEEGGATISMQLYVKLYWRREEKYQSDENEMAVYVSDG